MDLKTNGMESFKIRHVCQVCPTAWSDLALTGWIFMKFDISVFFPKCVEKFQE